MIHENSLLGRYNAGVIGNEEFLGDKLMSNLFTTAVFCLIVLVIGIILIACGHKRTGISTVICAVAFTLGAAAGLVMNPDISANIWEDENGMGVGILYLAYIFLTWLVSRIIYSEMRFYIRIPVMFVITFIMLIVTAIAYEFGLASVLSAMRGGFMFFTGAMIVLPLLPESDGGGSDIEDIIKDMTGDEY